MPAAELTAFLRSLQRLDYTRSRMEKLYADDRITKRDLESVYEALFLRAVTSFEVFLEELFVGILHGKVVYSSRRVTLRIKTISPNALREILLQGDKYLSWLPYNKTEERAKLYLKDGRPFSDLTEMDKTTMTTITTIRNAIAHKSDFAINKFKRTVIGSLPLLTSERYPAGFLRASVRSGKLQNRFQVYTGELGRLALALA